MTEVEWFACTDPEDLAGVLHEEIKANELSFRKLSLLYCACLRRIWHLLTDENSRRAIELTEDAIEDLRIDEEPWQVGQAGWAAQADAAGEGNYNTPLLRAISASGLAAAQAAQGDYQCLGNASDAVANYAAPPETRAFAVARDNERRAQVALIRCIFGNPFRRVAVGSAILQWNQGLVPTLARGIHDERAFDRLPVLADALEEAGCADSEIMEHCRQGGGHARGCWVADLILGYSLPVIEPSTDSGPEPAPYRPRNWYPDEEPTDV